MPKVELKFDLPEESGELEDALEGSKLRGAAQEYDNYLRGRLKYGNHNDDIEDALQDCRDKLHEIFENMIWRL